MRLLLSLMGALLLIATQSLAAGPDGFSDYPKMDNVDVHPIMKDEHVNQVPPPPEIIDDPLNPGHSNAVTDMQAQQDKSRKYKPKLKVSKTSKKSAAKALKKAKTVAQLPQNRKPSSLRRTGHYLF